MVDSAREWPMIHRFHQWQGEGRIVRCSQCGKYSSRLEIDSYKFVDVDECPSWKSGRILEAENE